MLDFTTRIDREHVAEVTRRVVHAKKMVQNSDPRGRLMVSWRQQNRFWALHPALFEHATGIPFREVLNSIGKESVRGNDPNDQEAARVRAIRDSAGAIAKNKPIEGIVFDNWNRWQFFPNLVRNIFKLDPEEMEIAVAEYGRQITTLVLEHEPILLEKLAEEEREYQERQRRYHEAREQIYSPADDDVIPNIFRMEADQAGANIRYVFAVEDADLYGHPELVQPILAGLWDVFRPWAARGGMNADYERRTLSVEVQRSILPGLQEEASKLSENVVKVLRLEPEATPPLSETKAISILQISRQDFRNLASIGEISPVRTVYISSGSLAGKEFTGYAPRDILDLKVHLHSADGNAGQND